MEFHDDLFGLFDEIGVRIDEDGIFLPKDFCLVCLLNFYNQKKLSDSEFDAITDFLYNLELAFKICDGNKDNTDKFEEENKNGN